MACNEDVELINTRLSFWSCHALLDESSGVRLAETHARAQAIAAFVRASPCAAADNTHPATAICTGTARSQAMAIDAMLGGFIGPLDALGTARLTAPLATAMAATEPSTLTGFCASLELTARAPAVRFAETLCLRNVGTMGRFAAFILGNLKDDIIFARKAAHWGYSSMASLSVWHVDALESGLSGSSCHVEIHEIKSLNWLSSCGEYERCGAVAMSGLKGVTLIVSILMAIKMEASFKLKRGRVTRSNLSFPQKLGYLLASFLQSLRECRRSSTCNLSHVVRNTSRDPKFGSNKVPKSSLSQRLSKLSSLAVASLRIVVGCHKGKDCVVLLELSRMITSPWLLSPWTMKTKLSPSVLQTYNNNDAPCATRGVANLETKASSTKSVKSCQL
ncbi:hypothetical protein Ae201684P_006802 [Aphanomyces euteiches]|nr:hypothetical protein Ae201684P_006802 [Aphanomyces euteiches]